MHSLRIYGSSKGSITDQTWRRQLPLSRNTAPTTASKTSASAFGADESAHVLTSYKQCKPKIECSKEFT